MRDFLLETFLSRLRAGVAVYQHISPNHERSLALACGAPIYIHNDYPPPSPIVLLLDKDGETLIIKRFKGSESSAAARSTTHNVLGFKQKKQENIIKLYECEEVRLASTADPMYPTHFYTGTAVLRDSCPARDIPQSFSLILRGSAEDRRRHRERTLDITCTTLDQCKILTAGFSSLCYYVHVQRSNKMKKEEKMKKKQEKMKKKVEVDFYKHFVV